MGFLDVSLHGWYKVSLTFKVIGKQEKDGVEVFKCVDNKGREFFMENSELFAHYTRNTSVYAETVRESLGDIIHRLQNTNSVFEVCFHKLDEEERIIRGYTVSSDDEFGYTKVHDLDSSQVKNVNNRGIKYLILNNVKYESK